MLRKGLMTKVAEYNFSRNKATVGALIVGGLIGIFNAYFPLIDFTLRPVFFGWLLLAVVLTVVVHEATHGAVALLLGNKPIFGFKPPLVYITFTDKIPRDHFIAIALAPFIILNIVFCLAFAKGVLRDLMYFSIFINTLGAIGDVWITFKLIRQARGTMIQDTKTGVEVWAN